jgi:hypothetical protein
MLEPIALVDAAGDFVGRSNLGWPFISSDPKYLPQALQLSEVLLRDLSPEAAFCCPAILNTRGQPRGLYQRAKGRVVFGCSRAIGNIEKMIFRPVFQSLTHREGFSAWGGQRSVDDAITYLISKAYGNARALLSMDFANFDATIPSFVLHAQFDILEELFSPSTKSLLRFVREHFIRCRLVTPSGTELHQERERGIPSGSVLTNLIGSMANVWMLLYASHILKNPIEGFEVQGDDGVYLFNEGVDVDLLAAVLKAHFGVEMSVEKSQHAHREVHFLQNVHRYSYSASVVTYDDGTHTASHMANVGIRPIMRVLNGMMSYERFRPNWNAKMDTLRWMQQVETAASHPMFSGFVDWFLGADKYAHLPVSQLIQEAGGAEAVNAVLGGGPWMNKCPVEAIERSRVASEIRRLRGTNLDLPNHWSGRDPLNG